VKQPYPSPQAEADVDQVVDHYLREADIDIAVGFITAYDEAVAHISNFPGTGSRRYSQPVGPLELRFWLLTRFPYAVFYIERDSHIDIVRVLHQSRDLPAELEL